MHKLTAKAPRDAHYYNIDSGRYYKIVKGEVREWHGNHWEVSFLNREDVESLIDFEVIKPLHINILVNFIIVATRIFIAVSAVSMFTAYAGS